MHISNRYLDLQPVLANIAKAIDVVGFHLSDDEKGWPGKNSSHWVALTRKPENMGKVFVYPRWQSDDTRLNLLGAVVWPSADPAVMTMSGLRYALQEMGEIDAKAKAEEEKKAYPPTLSAGWEPLETPEALQRELEETEQEWESHKAREKAEGRSEPWQAEAERLTRRLQRQREKVRTNRRVGVWTDDYSNLLSVFNF